MAFGSRSDFKLRRANAARTIQRSARRSKSSRARATTALVEKTVLRMAEQNCLRRAYPHLYQRWNHPMYVAGMCWTYPVGVGGTSMSHAGFHDWRSQVALRSGHEIFTSALRIKMTIAANENVYNTRCRVMFIEYHPTDSVTQRLLKPVTGTADAPQSVFGSTFNNTMWGAGPIDELFIGIDGRGSAGPYEKTLIGGVNDGCSKELNRLYDTVNTQTRNKFKVLRDFVVDLTKPKDGSIVGMVDHSLHPEASSFGAAGGFERTSTGGQTPGATSGNKNKAAGPGGRGAEHEFTLFDGGACNSRLLQFTIPFKRKLSYRTTPPDERSAEPETEAAREAIPINTDVMMVICPELNGGTPYTTPDPHEERLVLTCVDMTTELMFRDP